MAFCPSNLAVEYSGLQSQRNPRCRRYKETKISFYYMSSILYIFSFSTLYTKSSAENDPVCLIAQKKVPIHWNVNTNINYLARVKLFQAPYIFFLTVPLFHFFVSASVGSMWCLFCPTLFIITLFGASGGVCFVIVAFPEYLYLYCWK